MVKVVIGFILGIAVPALAQEGWNWKTDTAAVLMTGLKPDGGPSPIRVDKDGYVICAGASK